MNIRELKGVGKKTQEVFEKKGIETSYDLATFFPIRFEDRRKKLSFLTSEKGYFEGKVIDKRLYISRSKKEILTVHVASDEFIVKVIYFNSRYLDGIFQLDKSYIFYGELNRKTKSLEMIHPVFASIEKKDEFLRIEPQYSSVRGVAKKKMQTLINQSLELLPDDYILDEHDIELEDAICELHVPTDRKRYVMALARFILHEFVSYLLENQRENQRNQGFLMESSKENSILLKIPFKLTKDQKQAMSDIKKDLQCDRQMKRLIQGDVGSGKSIVGFYAMHLTVTNQFQASYLAPTEILARQQATQLASLVQDRVELLISSTKDKKAVLKRIESGESKYIVGTHALFQEAVSYKNLGLVVIDEQHRFGVRQREKMIEKGKNPNVLMLSATPIPRTLSMILYSNLDLSIIKEKPKDRKEVFTQRLPQSKREIAYQKIEEEVEKGNCAFIVLPLIQDNEDLDLASIEKEVFKIKQRFALQVGVLHGHCTVLEREEVLNKLVKKEIDILVATTVIEVGIDIAHATVMIIENAERFGLSQLHQLRGRIGRNNQSSYCYVISDFDKDRLKVLENSSDGFFLAEEDLRLRGAGEAKGTAQHGTGDFKKANPLKHIRILEKAKEIVEHQNIDLNKYKKWRRDMIE